MIRTRLKLLIVFFTIVAIANCSNNKTGQPAGIATTDYEVCGDGYIGDPSGNSSNTNSEQCDDGNTVDGDGCSSICENQFPPESASIINLTADAGYKTATFTSNKLVLWYLISAISGSAYDVIVRSGFNTYYSRKATFFDSNGNVINDSLGNAVKDRTLDTFSQLGLRTAIVSGNIYVKIRQDVDRLEPAPESSELKVRVDNTVPASAINLIADAAFLDRTITNEGQVNWYSINVLANTPYKLFTNTEGLGGSGYGDGTQTGNVAMYLVDSNGNIDYTYSSDLYSRGMTIIRNTSTTVFMKASPYLFETGSYQVKYATVADTTITLDAPFISGNITTNPYTDMYSFDVLAGSSYKVFWTSGSTLNSELIAFSSTGSEISLGSIPFIVPFPIEGQFTASANEKIFVEVHDGSFSLDGGTYKIQAINWPPTGATSIIADAGYVSGSHAATFEMNWYSFNATANSKYKLILNDNFKGDTTQTGEPKVSVYKADGTLLVKVSSGLFSNLSYYDVGETLTDTISQTLYILAIGRTTGGLGTYKLKVDNWPPVASALTVNNVFTNGSFLAGEIKWYKFNATQNGRYTIEANQSVGGDGTQTASLRVSAIKENDGVPYFFNSSCPFNLGEIFQADQTGVVYVKVYGVNNTSNGTFQIKVNSWPPASATSFTVDAAYTSGFINIYEADWYSINVLQNSKYRVFWKDSQQGDGQTSNISVQVYDIDGIEQSFTPSNSIGYYTGSLLSADKTETYYVKTNGFTTGTYEIKVNTFPVSGATSLILDAAYSDGNILSNNNENWYSYDATTGVPFKIYWNDINEGNATKTSNIYVSAYTATAANLISGIDNGYVSGSQITPTATEKISIRVFGTTGTYQIKISTP